MGPVAQLVRALRLHRRGRRFESGRAHCLHAGVDTKVFCRKDARRYDFSLILCGSRTLVPAACGCVRALQETISVKPVGIPQAFAPCGDERSVRKIVGSDVKRCEPLWSTVSSYFGQWMMAVISLVVLHCCRALLVVFLEPVLGHPRPSSRPRGLYALSLLLLLVRSGCRAVLL